MPLQTPGGAERRVGGRRCHPRPVEAVEAVEAVSASAAGVAGCCGDDAGTNFAFAQLSEWDELQLEFRTRQVCPSMGSFDRSSVR